AARRMIFTARSRLPVLAASQACSASLRARRRSLSFCFLAVMRLSRAAWPTTLGAAGPRSGMRIIRRVFGPVRYRGGSAGVAQGGRGGALTEKDADEVTHEGIVERQSWGYKPRRRAGLEVHILASTFRTI